MTSGAAFSIMGAGSPGTHNTGLDHRTRRVRVPAVLRKMHTLGNRRTVGSRRWRGIPVVHRPPKGAEESV